MASALSKRAAAHPSKILKDDALDYTDDDAAADYLLDQAKQRGVISVAAATDNRRVFCFAMLLILIHKAGCQQSRQYATVYICV
jgi:hypothetical protein